MGGNIISNTIFSKQSNFKPLTPCLYNPIKRFSEAKKAKRAPSTADVIEEVAEEKRRAAGKGVSSRPCDDAAGDSKDQSAKQTHEEHKPGVDHRGKGDNHG